MRHWLKEWRDINGLTQKKAAEFLDMPETTLASYEQGHRTPSVSRAKKMAVRMNDISKKKRVKWTYFFEDKVHNTSK
ncbi:prophage P1 protein 9, phage transcription regulator, Cro/CI family [Lactiplantibacillus plantarum]|uniref:helix-turn-helix domain-containing protein n=1 Tax=Lactiplantibacillus plantarum TaxID=1590 RepID=UPI000B3C20DC|nr:helix-turn-helix transcriptional regulator [Lactiplantibacillus plantarum]MCG0592358.1 prophage P1 protein 9, phage transcription regulator, Cro/CI family [Lactiplantibacillus plantarum]MCG0671011.1 prophage P1 protein 9, phage transcription regulator, Cro/CI family [Lactiplantibacillus plantarum]MCG0920241.1 prophage P1 protein 9, phage transcription regulator, Cro/CI family [Lactiplantibacillus plantarum]MEC5117796.1 helix-turn-helix transcriptional regulator [Lactiplantibacillus plantarum